MESLRRVALYLHALAPSDQRWMLQRLPAEHTPTLRSMLRELKAMGIPRDPLLLPAASSNEEPPAAQPVSTTGRERIAQADGTAIAGLLKGEPREVVAAILRTGDWGWEDDLLNTYGAAERSWFSEHADARRALPPAVRETLITLLDRRLQRTGNIVAEHDGRVPNTGNAPWWKRLARGMSWRR